MVSFFRKLAAAVLIAGAAIAFSAPASAGDPQIDAAKAQGIVGERDGKCFTDRYRLSLGTGQA